MGPGNRSVEDLLLDWHLGRLDEEDRSWLEEEFRTNAELRDRSDRLGRILQPLDHWQIATPQPNLADKVLAHVSRSTGVESVSRSAAANHGGGLIRFPFTSIRDLVAVAACILLLLGVFIPGISTVRGRAQRAMCADNLGSIFRGTSTYREACAGSLPFAAGLQNASWLPGGASDRPYASNSRHLYMLVKLDYGVAPEDFICPGEGTGVPMQVDEPRKYDDFPSTCNVSYATLNMAGASPNVRPVTPVAYISDTNPLFVGAKFDASVDPDRTNSPAHRGKGQNVLTLDGNARWTTEPVYGRQRDNLWLIDNIRRYTGTEAPTREDDVQLVPGFPATDPAICRALQH